MDVTDLLPVREQNDINPIVEGDYQGADGLIYCGKCHTPKQFHARLKNFDRIVACLCKCQVEKREQEAKKLEYEEQMRRIEWIKRSSMMASKYRDAAFERYVVRSENENVLKLARKYVENFGDMAKKNQGLLFWGPVGTGKSYTAACIANALMGQCIPVIMTSFVKVLQDIHGEEDEAAYIEVLNRAALLVIDDLGSERSTDYALEKVYNVIDGRARTEKPMILTTNLTLRDMLNNGDIRYRRIYDRIFECCYPVEIPGRSFRQQEAAHRFEEMKKLMEA